MFTEKIFDAGTIKINYAEGAPNGSPLVFLHGGAGRWQAYESLIKELENVRHVYACDLRGHGKSSWGDSYRVVDMANDTVEFIKRNVGEPVVLIGHSGGAVASLVTAAQIPEFIQKLIVIDPPIFLREESLKSDPAYNFFKNVYDVTTHKRTAKDVISEMFPESDEGGKWFLEEMFNTVDPEFLKTLLEDRIMDGMDTQAVLEKITCPTLMIYGEVDKGAVVRDSDFEFFNAYISHGKAVQIKNAGHLIHLDQLEQLVKLIDQFLKT